MWFCFYFTNDGELSLRRDIKNEIAWCVFVQCVEEMLRLSTYRVYEVKSKGLDMTVERLVVSDFEQS